MPPISEVIRGSGGIEYEVAVDLRCGKANTKTPRSFARQTSRVKTVLPLARPPLQKTPTGSTDPASPFNTPTHVFQATSAPVAQEEDPTLRYVVDEQEQSRRLGCCTVTSTAENPAV